jgi:hypothetical protein
LTAAVLAGPVARANRVVYRAGPLTQWYANGPAGLEQGFTVAAPPRATGRTARQRPLTIALAVSGNAGARLGAGGVVFGRPGHGLAYRDLVVSDARGRPLHAWLSLRPGTLMLHASTAGARYPLTVDPTFQQLAKLTASDGAGGDALGSAVAISGDTVVAGAPFASPGSSSQQGAAYVFTKPGGGWASETQAAKLTSGGGGPTDLFGFSVAIDGDTVVAGAPNTLFAQGGAYVFLKPLGGWADESQNAKLTASDAANGDNLGYSVAISGDTVVAGAPQEAASGHGSAGAAYVFTKPGGGWSSETEAAKLTVSGAPGGYLLGWSVAVSGGTVAAGAQAATVGPNGGQGAVYVFTEPGGGWADETEAAELTASDGAASDGFGYFVAISGTTMVIGAPFATVGSTSQQGAVYVFTGTGSSWVQAAKLTASDGAAFDEFGWTGGISGTTMATGAPNAMVGAHANQGAAYVFGSPSGPPPPPPSGYRLAGFFSPPAGAHRRAGSVIVVSTGVDYADGTPVPGWLAAEFGADCEVTVHASGAQRLPARCLHWDLARQRLEFRWPTGARHAGKVTLVLRLGYLTPDRLAEGITLTHHRKHHPGHDRMSRHG